MENTLSSDLMSEVGQHGIPEADLVYARHRRRARPRPRRREVQAVENFEIGPSTGAEGT
jgi:hypothetical protein